jgi:hypothetical protein
MTFSASVLTVLFAFLIISCGGDQIASPPERGGRTANSDVTPCNELEEDCTNPPPIPPGGSCLTVDPDHQTPHPCDLFPVLGSDLGVLRSEALRLMAHPLAVCRDVGAAGLSAANQGRIRYYWTPTYIPSGRLNGDSHPPERLGWPNQMHIYAGSGRTENSILRTFRHESAHFAGYPFEYTSGGEYGAVNLSDLCA